MISREVRGKILTIYLFFHRYQEVIKAQNASEITPRPARQLRKGEALNKGSIASLFIQAQAQVWVLNRGTLFPNDSVSSHSKFKI